MTCPFKAGETYRTRDGREARVYATDGGDPTALHGAVKNDRGEWHMRQWCENGMTLWSEGCDLITPKKAVWVAVYRNAFGKVDCRIVSAEQRKQQGDAFFNRIALLGPVEIEDAP